MKIIHFADLHLGVETYGHIDAITGLNTRFQDFLTAFDKLVDYAIDNKVDLVLFCGDAFKSREPSQTQQREFARRIKKLADHAIPVFLLIGNHDLPATSGRATSTEIYDTLKIPGVTVAGQPKLYLIETAAGPVQVSALPWPRKSALEGRAQSDGQPLSTEELKTGMESILSSKIRQMADNVDSSIPSIMAAHIWVDGAKIGSENKMILGTEPTVMLGNIALSAFDYVALGHLHKRQVLNEIPPVIYSGSLERLDFGEEKDTKGFYLIDIAIIEGKKKVNYEFHRLDGRRFLTLEITLAEGDLDPTSPILTLLDANKEHITNAVVQLKIKLPESLVSLLRDTEIKNALKDAHYFVIARDVERQNRSRMGGTEGETLTPRQALEKYLIIRNVTEARRLELMAYAENIFVETTTL
ncbi:exonuclease SbcD [Dehalogenimonas sp. WBC-2]|nr:exonuclease SbcD [Dehalogenimonas sp. WBC-2]